MSLVASHSTVQNAPRISPRSFSAGMAWTCYLFPFACAISIAAFLLATIAHAQQTQLKRYDVYVGFADLNSPALGLNQTGLHTQFGVNVRRWYAMGFDYSVSSGSTVLKPDLLPITLQEQLAPIIVAYIEAGVIPPTYQLALPADITTQSFAAGPQFAYRHFSRVTLFVRPSVGAFRLAATAHPADPVTTTISHALVPSGHKVDWTDFYGLGGGDEILLTPHFGVRSQMDVVYNHPFNDILANGFWTMRYSVGLNIHAGKDIFK
ncbi:MAG TPA: hypothetical protein VFN62_10285 [Acidobacteriaceae bacterium]|nr:hypothetical protein [Acidobacteriaceae bacterium]